MSSIAALGATTGSTQTTSTNNQLAPANKTDGQMNQFLQLLVAQLKGQNPLNPLDGTQFVTQLAQFSGLQELVGIHSTLEDLKKAIVPEQTSSAVDSGGGI